MYTEKLITFRKYFKMAAKVGFLFYGPPCIMLRTWRYRHCTLPVDTHHSVRRRRKNKCLIGVTLSTLISKRNNKYLGSGFGPKLNKLGEGEEGKRAPKSPAKKTNLPTLINLSCYANQTFCRPNRNPNPTLTILT